ncbi:hypothetical protein G4B88_020954 [Cannabis sativa]|uniref:EF-hand domain-containing protein n=2 Tax=Cannabis sativa TaxID=3483 RepID=A0A7J6EJR9_CANSA|nr:hypothetical protein G4B88_020954 [Cannabis sativa]
MAATTTNEAIQSKSSSVYLQNPDELQKVFSQFHTNDDGKISVSELGDVLKKTVQEEGLVWFRCSGPPSTGDTLTAAVSTMLSSARSHTRSISTELVYISRTVFTSAMTNITNVKIVREASNSVNSNAYGNHFPKYRKSFQIALACETRNRIEISFGAKLSAIDTTTRPDNIIANCHWHVYCNCIALGKHGIKRLGNRAANNIIETPSKEIITLKMKSSQPSSLHTIAKLSSSFLGYAVGSKQHSATFKTEPGSHDPPCFDLRSDLSRMHFGSSWNETESSFRTIDQ